MVLGLGLGGGGGGGEAAGWVEGAAWGDEDVAAQVDGDGLSLRGWGGLLAGGVGGWFGRGCLCWCLLAD